MGRFPQCKHHKRDCFALMKDGCCFCLNNTNFFEDGERILCPFYKSQKDIDQIRDKEDPVYVKWMEKNLYYLKKGDRYNEGQTDH